jgi:hypothetical protein
MSSCEHGTQPTVCIKWLEFLDWSHDLLASQEGPCSTELHYTYTCSIPTILQSQNTPHYLFRDYLVGGISMRLCLKYNCVHL